MTVTESLEYGKLKEYVLLNVANSKQYTQLLCTLKELFCGRINSPRRYEQIINIKDLLRILEVRDVLSEDDVSPLKEIANRLPNSHELLQRIRDYEANPIPQCANYSVPGKTQSIPINKPIESTVINYNNTNPNTNMSVRKKQSIVNAVVDDIGTNWRDLARGLDIKEKIIDDLNVKYKETSKKAMCIMELYNNRESDQNTWFFDLCDALETCNRRDIVRKLKKKIVMNI